MGYNKVKTKVINLEEQAGTIFTSTLKVKAEVPLKHW
jgi:hypothetical protein